MAPISPKTARLEIRIDRRGKLRAYYDGEPLRGVISIDVEHNYQYGGPATTTIVFSGAATRLVTEMNEEFEDGD